MTRVLVIDDEESIRWVFREMLEPQGYQIAEAPDGKVGLELYRKQPADLVIVDLLMPEKEGLETILELRRMDPGSKIIAISGGFLDGAFDLLPVARKFGAQRTFHKPFNLDEMEVAIRELLGPVTPNQVPA